MTGEVAQWWHNLPDRLLHEKEKVHELQKKWEKTLKNIEWVELKSGQLSIQGQILIAEKIKTFDLIFPVYYPSECPTVYPVPRGEKWSVHQFGGSAALCLEYGPDNWESRLCAADLIESLVKLLISEKLVEEKIISEEFVPSRHEGTLFEYLRGKYYRFLASESFQKILLDMEAKGKWKALFVWSEETCTIIPTELPLEKNVAENIPKGLLTKGRSYEGIWLKLDSECETEILNGIKDLSDVNYLIKKLSGLQIKFGESIGFKQEDIKDFTPLLIISKEGNFFSGVLRNTAKDGLYFKVAGTITTSFNTLKSRISKDIQDALKDKKIGIIGLGSVGSKVAATLARTGIEKFVLVDDDIVLPENITRNELNALHIGGSKIDQVSDVIQSISINPGITRHDLKIGEQCNTAIHENVLKDLRSCDLIIECTASPTSFLISSMIASQSKITMVWVEVFGGGLGGFVARSSPKYDPCPVCVRKAYLNHFSLYPPAPGKTEQNYELEIDSSKIIVASDSDVAFTSALASHVAISCLSNDELLFVREAVILFGLKREWVFDAPFQFIKLNVDAAIWQCPDCWNSFRPSEISAEQKTAYDAMLQTIKKEQ